MNPTVALLGLVLGQPPAAAPEYHLFNTRALSIPVEYRHDPKTIRRVELHVSKDLGQVWEKAGDVPPTQNAFPFTAPADGRYWFQIQVVDLKGGKDPPNMTAEPPAQMVLVDTKPPLVTFTTARRDGDVITVEWRVDDQFPDEASARVSFRSLATPDAPWRMVEFPPGVPRSGIRFGCETPGPVQVRVAVADRVGNPGEAVRDFPATGGGQTTTSLSPAAAGSGAPVPPPDSLVPTPPTGGPVAPAAPPPATPAPMTPATEQPTPAPVATFDPRGPAGPAPLATAPAGAAPATPTAPARVVQSTRFDVNYQVEVEGSSKVGRIDLWVTRDDGRTWRPWSQHPGNDPVLKVDLGGSLNRQPEGLYGLRLVSFSGAGLSEAPPGAGDAPDLRVMVDLTKPEVKIFPPAADPVAPDALVLQWWAGDTNFGDEPITIEWCDPATPGAWRPVVVPYGSDLPVQQAGAFGPATARRLPNTGRYSWRVPAGLPPRVLLKVSARDAAGNVTEQVTRDPVLIDLTKPRARITGIGTPARP